MTPIRPPWLLMIGVTAAASQVLAVLFMLAVCSYLGGKCQLSGAVVAGMW